MPRNNQLINKKVAEIYDWLDSQIRQNPHLAGQCKTCGKCCDFEKFDHKLFVSTPELIYLSQNLEDNNIKTMTTTRCPYNIDGKCTIRPYRFAACRIFCCSADPDFQSRITEKVLNKFKSICKELDVPYLYTDLPTALNQNTAP